MSTNRLEKFLGLPETCSVIPASCNSDQQPEAEAVLQEVAALPHNYSKVSNNLFSFIIYPLYTKDSITRNDINYCYLSYLYSPNVYQSPECVLWNFLMSYYDWNNYTASSPDAQQYTVYQPLTCIIERDIEYEQ